jgi:hypothetical protein
MHIGFFVRINNLDIIRRDQDYFERNKYNNLKMPLPI